MKGDSELVWHGFREDLIKCDSKGNFWKLESIGFLQLILLNIIDESCIWKMNAKSLIFWEIPRNTLIWPKSAEIGDIDVKYIYFPFNFGPKCWGQSVFGHNITPQNLEYCGRCPRIPWFGQNQQKRGLLMWNTSIFLISPVQNVSANQYLAKKLPS